MRVLAKNAPLNAVAHELSVLTYNVLAPLYVRPLDARTGGVQQFAAFGWAEPAAERLDWRPTIGFVDLVEMMVDADMALLEGRLRNLS